MAEQPDLVTTILTRIGLPDQDNEFRAALVVLGANQGDVSDATLAIALVGTLMVKANTPRPAMLRAIQALATLPPERLAEDTASIVLMDGTVIFLPGQPDGQFCRMDDLKTIQGAQVPVPVMTVVFHTANLLQIVQSVRKAA